jgi:deoxycytidylate deaminase
MINRHKLLEALNIAFDETVHAEYRQRMAACLLDKDGNILAIGHNNKRSYFWMKQKNGYRRDQRGSHCELDAVRNYVSQYVNKTKNLSVKATNAVLVNSYMNNTEEQEEMFFEFVRSLKIPMIVVARRKGGILSDTRGSSRPCKGCWEFLRRCGIKSVVYYDEDNHFIEEKIK